MASVSQDGTIKLWDVAEKKPNNYRNFKDVISFSFSRNDSKIALLTKNRNLKLIDLISDKIIFSIDLYDNPKEVLFNRNDKSILVGIDNNKHNYKYLSINIKTHKITNRKIFVKSNLKAMRYKNNTIDFYDWSGYFKTYTNKNITLNGIFSSGHVSNFSYGNKDKLLTVSSFNKNNSSDSRIDIFNKKKLIKTIEESRPIYDMKISLDNKNIIYKILGYIKSLNIKTGNINTVFSLPKDYKSVDFYWSDKKSLLSSLSDKRVDVWDFYKKHLLVSFDIESKYYDDKVSFSTTGKYISIYSEESNKLSLINLETILERENTDWDKEIKYSEKYFQLKMNDTNLVTQYPRHASLYHAYNLPAIWPKQHIEHWLLKLKKEPNNPEYMYQIALIHDRDNNRYHLQPEELSAQQKKTYKDDNCEALSWYQKALEAGSTKAEERIIFLTGWMERNHYTFNPCQKSLVKGAKKNN